MPIRAPFFSLEQLRAAADVFLATHNPNRTIPVPIEKIIELQLKMDIVPVPGLHGNFDIDAYLTSDLQEIRVDQSVHESREHRYRFSLAHEVGHRVLHADVFKQLTFSSVDEWKASRSLIGEREYRYLEWHANAFAGFVLVPKAELALEFDLVKRQLADIGFSLDGDSTNPAAWEALEQGLARRFNVSGYVIGKRGPVDGLWDA